MLSFSSWANSTSPYTNDIVFNFGEWDTEELEKLLNSKTYKHFCVMPNNFQSFTLNEWVFMLCMNRVCEVQLRGPDYKKVLTLVHHQTFNPNCPEFSLLNDCKIYHTTKRDSYILEGCQFLNIDAEINKELSIWTYRINNCQRIEEKPNWDEITEFMNFHNNLIKMGLT